MTPLGRALERSVGINGDLITLPGVGVKEPVLACLEEEKLAWVKRITFFSVPRERRC
jgi:hypothetical protein